MKLSEQESDAAEYQFRRRQQNRIAQQRHRDKKKEKRKSTLSIEAASSSTSTSKYTAPSIDKVAFSDAFDIDYASLPSWMLIYLILPSPRTSSFQIPCVHLAKAVYENTRRLGVDYQIMSSCSGRSYIAESWAMHCGSDAGNSRAGMEEANETSRSLNWSNVPDNMHPTLMQLTIPHHPFIDVAFVWPKMRDKILLLCSRGTLDDKHLCKDTLSGQLPGAKLESAAFILYGDDPMDEEAWEVGQEWAMKYWRLLDDRLIRRTNWWRRQRGLLDLDIPKEMISSSQSAPIACR